MTLGRSAYTKSPPFRKEEAFMHAHEWFNQPGLSRFLNSTGGRTFRLVAGIGFLLAGTMFRDQWLGLASMAWGTLAMTAGAIGRPHPLA